MIKKLIIGFSTIVSLLIALGIFSVVTMKDLALETQKIYDHPFKITTSVKNINININLLSMDKDMKDIVFSTNETDLQKRVSKLETNDLTTLEEFYQKTDVALYEVKQKRNSVVIKSMAQNLMDTPSLPPLQIPEDEKETEHA